MGKHFKNQFAFKIAWAQMPLSEEQLKAIPHSHRVRPYLLCMDMGDYYYAFPTTSKIYDNKYRYENEKVLINGMSSLVRIHELYILPKENLLEIPRVVSRVYSNEIIKKINACMKYGKYPTEFMEFFSKKDYYLEETDIIEYMGSLYLIINSDYKSFFLHRVYPFPVDNSVMIELDGSKFYVDISKIYNIDKDKNPTYYTRVNQCSLDGIDIKTWLLDRPILRNQKDYTKVKNLMPGMIIDTFFDGESVRMIILEKKSNEIKAMYGDASDTYSNYQLGCFPYDSISSYMIFGTLSDERFSKLRDKHIRKEINKKKTYE